MKMVTKKLFFKAFLVILLSCVLTLIVYVSKRRLTLHYYRIYMKYVHRDSNGMESFIDRQNELYKQRYKTNPPSHYTDWLLYAKYHNCITDNYDLPMNYLLRLKKLNSDKEKAISKSNIYNFEMEHVVRIEYSSSFGFSSKSPGYVRDMLGPIVHILPDNFFFLFNLYDEPRIFRGDDIVADVSEETVDDKESKRLVEGPHVSQITKDLYGKCSSIRKQFPYHSFLNRNTYDYPFYSAKTMPMFSSASIKDCFLDIPVPTKYHINILKQKQAQVVSWNKKNSVKGFVWRGSTTGNRLTDYTIRVLPKAHQRFNFVHHFGKKPLHDVAFTKVIQHDKDNNITDIEGQLRLSYEFQKEITMQNIVKNKYLPDIDGNTFSQRFLIFLKISKSLIFKSTIFDEFVLTFAVPWKHYVPFDVSLVDIDDLLKKYSDNEKESETIANNAFELGRDHLRKEDMVCYWGRVMLEYTNIYTF